MALLAGIIGGIIGGGIYPALAWWKQRKYEKALAEAAAPVKKAGEPRKPKATAEPLPM